MYLRPASQYNLEFAVIPPQSSDSLLRYALLSCEILEVLSWWLDWNFFVSLLSVLFFSSFFRKVGLLFWIDFFHLLPSFLSSSYRRFVSRWYTQHSLSTMSYLSAAAIAQIRICGSVSMIFSRTGSCGFFTYNRANVKSEIPSTLARRSTNFALYCANVDF